MHIDDVAQKKSELTVFSLQCVLRFFLVSFFLGPFSLTFDFLIETRLITVKLNPLCAFRLAVCVCSIDMNERKLRVI